MRCNDVGTIRFAMQDTAAIRVLVADDHAPLLKEIVGLLSTQFEVAGAVQTGPALVQMAERLAPDVIVADLRMGASDGIEVCCEIMRRKLCMATLILSAHSDSELVELALKAGIGGYVLKVDAGDDLIPAVQEVLNGRTFLSKSLRNSRSHHGDRH